MDRSHPLSQSGLGAVTVHSPPLFSLPRFPLKGADESETTLR
jgi:hypothetical protein